MDAEKQLNFLYGGSKMEKIITILRENPTHFLATIGSDGYPKVRPFGFMMFEDGKLYYCTNNTKNVYAQLQAQPYLELCVCTSQFAWVRVSGKAVFVDELEIKEKVLESSAMVKNIYQTADNPILEVFYLDEAKAVLADFSGNPPREYIF
jgi:uncharacterized pyridoxamine 5'-phosphate oxidase family protein